MYARYIPPAKPASASAPAPAPAAAAVAAPPRPPPGGIIAPAGAPASGAYGRYIPPPKLEEAAKMNKKIIFDDEPMPEPPAKKAKVETPEADNEPTSAKKDKKDKKKKKKKTEKNKTDTSAAVEDDLEMAEAPAKEKSPEPAELPVKEKSPDLAEPPAEENSAELVESPAKEKSPEIADSPVKEKKQKREKKKKPKAETETNDTGIDDEQVNQRHKGVFEKKAKSMKAPDPEKVVDRQDEDQDVSMPDAPEPEEVHGLQPLPQPEPRAPEAPTAPQTELPSWIYDHITVPRDEKKPFTDFGLRPDCGITPEASKRLEAKGYKEAHAVQTAVIPQLLPHHCLSMHSDLLVSAETGSGKTLAYALPIIRDLSWSRSPRTYLRAIVVVPSKNLARQVMKVCEECAEVFSDLGTKRVKVGIATGNRSLDEEKGVLVERNERWDPEGYKERQERIKTRSRRARYDDNSEDEERNRLLAAEDRIKTLPNHVFEYDSKVDILICTPGRLLEHIKLTIGFNLDWVRWLVLDETDKFFGQNHQQFLDVVIPKLQTDRDSFQRRSHMQTGLTGVRKVIVSASMTTDLDKLGPLRLRRPKLVEMAPEDGDETRGRETMLSLPATLRESAIKVDLELKPLFLLDLLESNRIMSDDADDSSDSDSSSAAAETSLPPKTLIFTRTRENAIRLARLLAIMSPKLEPLVKCLTSDSTDKTQTQTLKKFRAGKIRIIIASDLIARGIDLPDVKHVINYDMPNSVTAYVHRVGRTARAERSGHAWTLYTYQEARWFFKDIAGKDAEVRRSGEVERVRITEEKEDAFEEKKTRFEAAVSQLADEGGA
ncbi:P-loop containing nucleoside triphosphate hydrolase protein [Apiospora arundinis]|uniref:ATP-dependent RNA helicase n=1 Tax=Apiospora arundinis TaxID=335852 RepID=A0ABR2IGX0_9PEZI